MLTKLKTHKTKDINILISLDVNNMYDNITQEQALHIIERKS